MPRPAPHPPDARPRSVLLAMEFYIHAVHEGVVRYARQAGWALDASMVHMHVLPTEWRGDGVLCEVNTGPMEASVRRFRRPVVAMVIEPRRLRCPRVLLDNPSAGRLGAEHLIQRGFRRLAFYLSTPSSVNLGRCEGFRRAALDAGCEFFLIDLSKAPASRLRRGRTRWLVETLSSLPKPLGLMANSDQWAIEAINACRVASLAVPEQVAVVGVDNDPLYVDVAPVPLTSVDIDLEGVGYRAAELLDERMRAAEDGAAWASYRSAATRSVIVPPVGIMTRRSTDILAAEDPAVAKALGFIFRHYRSPITVEEVASHAGVSLRRLQSRFRKELGRPMVGEVTRLRVEHAQRLLRNTSLRIDAIARDCGFSAGKYFAKVFTSQTGQSPRGYRKAQGGIAWAKNNISTGG